MATNQSDADSSLDQARWWHTNCSKKGLTPSVQRLLARMDPPEFPARNIAGDQAVPLQALSVRRSQSLYPASSMSGDWWSERARCFRVCRGEVVNDGC